jgi:hypothetical protein
VAKKKRKKSRRPPTRPSTKTSAASPEAVSLDEEEETEAKEAARKEKRRRGAPTAPISNRQARKEAARRERERRIKAARRRARIRRAIRWGIVLVVLGGIGAFIWLQVSQRARILAAADEAAPQLGCGAIQDTGEGAQGHYQPGEQPTPYQEVPATAGKHSPGIYTGPPVLTQPVDLNVEIQLVHNLEHGYILMYYRPDGPKRVPEPVLSALEDLADSEDKVLLAPYPALPQGQSLALVAWTKIQPCTDLGPGNAEAAVDVARGFIERFRGGGDAPEPGGV